MSPLGADSSASAAPSISSSASLFAREKKIKKSRTRRPTVINGTPVTFTSHEQAVTKLTELLGPLVRHENASGRGQTKRARKRANKKAAQKLEEEVQKVKEEVEKKK